MLLSDHTWEKKQKKKKKKKKKKTYVPNPFLEIKPICTIQSCEIYVELRFNKELTSDTLLCDYYVSVAQKASSGASLDQETIQFTQCETVFKLRRSGKRGKHPFLSQLVD